MMSSAAFLLVAALALTVLTHAQPLSDSSSARAPSPPDHTPRLQKRTVSKEPNAEELAVLKDLILSRVASELSESLREQPTSKRAKEEEERQKEAEEEEAMIAEARAKRLFAPLSGLPGEIPTMKRLIRYHQCYFNPISCFRRK
uniref:C-type preproallatostatin n=1 Tax=Pandalus japonicus TaxID=666362 RepID=K7S1Y0_PANJP|nr:C-type preproallatostatin [Pandalus japonicus]